MAFRLTDISIRTRLYVLLGGAILSTGAALAIYGYLFSEFRVNGPRHEPIKLKRITRSEIAPPTIYLVEMYLTLQEMETAKPEDMKDLLSVFRGQVSKFEESRNAAVARLTDEKLRRKIETDVTRTAQDLISLAQTQYVPLLTKARDKDKDQVRQKEISDVLREKLAPAFRAHRAQVVEADKAIDETVVKLEDAALVDSRFYRTWLITGSVVFLAVLAVLGWVTTRGILNGTDLLLGRVSEMASGASDLTARIPIASNDELGKLAEGINAMIAKIQAIVAKVREASIQLLSTASEIAATARQQDTTVQGLSSATTQVAAAVREISATSKELSGTMSDVNDRANQAATLALAGRSRLGDMERTMGRLVDSTAGISTKLATIREKADSINVIVTTITKVADQTNLLSINAAIEAEKAGEYGRGFLVVAREIRRLADQTAVATLDIENMVRHMQDAVSTGVMQMDKFSEEVRTGVGRVAEVNTQTGQIIEEVHGLSQSYHSVNEGMRNQSIGAEQINEAMQSMTGNIRQTALALEEFNRATAHLRGSVEALNQEVAAFKT